MKGRAWLGALGVALASACGYHGGSFRGPRGTFDGERVTVGCLDVAVAAHRDAAVRGRALAFEFGNRCDRPARVDLGAVVVTGRTASGREVTMYAYDPDGELRPARLEARRVGREVIEYRAVDPDPVVLACADLAPMAGEPGARVVCVGEGAPL
jgi:hypothetical protein